MKKKSICIDMIRKSLKHSDLELFEFYIAMFIEYVTVCETYGFIMDHEWKWMI